MEKFAVGDHVTTGVTVYAIQRLERKFRQDGAVVVIVNPGPGDGYAPRWVSLSGMRKVPHDRRVTLTVADQQALADVMGDAYAYRLGESYPEDVDPADKEAMDRIVDLAARLGINPSY